MGRSKQDSLGVEIGNHVWGGSQVVGGALTHAVLEGRHDLCSIPRHVQGIGVDVKNLPFLLFLPLQLQPAPLFCGQQPHSGGEVSLAMRKMSRQPGYSLLSWRQDIAMKQLSM